jgi:tetratricopeptide (TPR) repeat protein
MAGQLSRFAAFLGGASWLALASTATADETPHARIVASRIGRSEQGIPRLVIETDRPVQFLTVELTSRNGFDLHLMGADLGGAMPPKASGALRDVTFATSSAGVVARVLLDETRRVGCAFALTNPPRVVLDLPAKEGRRDATLARNRAKTVAAKPAAPAELPRVAPPVPSSARPAVAVGAGPPADPDLADVAAFARDLSAALDAIQLARDPIEALQARRQLAHRLATRNLLEEAEDVLFADRAGADGPLSVADSLWVAELRQRRGDTDGAIAIATALDASRLEDSGRLRLARVLLDGGSAGSAPAILEPVLASTDGGDRARAAFLTARSHWESGRPTDALPLVAGISLDAATPDDVIAGAALLEADCLFALSRPADSRRCYERAAHLGLGPEESSWTSLQLGNLARRDGRLGDARRYYEATTSRWPNTFFAAQAEWFLRFDERLTSSRVAKAERVRG